MSEKKLSEADEKVLDEIAKEQNFENWKGLERRYVANNWVFEAKAARKAVVMSRKATEQRVKKLIEELMPVRNINEFFQDRAKYHVDYGKREVLEDLKKELKGNEA